MNTLAVLLAFLLLESALANDHCLNQTIVGFEEAVFMMGADIGNSNVQEIVDGLAAQTGMQLTRVDTFVTSKMYFELLRNAVSNELVLMTLNAEYVCFYMVPTEVPTRQMQAANQTPLGST